LVQRAREYVRAAQVRVEIGTAAPLDVKGAEETLATVERAAAPPSLKHGEAGTHFVMAANPTDAEIATVRNRYAEALRGLDAALMRFDNGLAGTKDVDAAFAAAVAAITDPPAPARPVGSDQHSAPVRFVTRSGANTADSTSALPDAELIAALRNAGTMPNEVQRANTLLALAARNAFTPDMVALYVAAANGITSSAERARVFAQPIRVKPGGGR
jgi:hypothetical protein